MAELVIKIAGSSDGFQKEIDKIRQSTEKLETQLTEIARGATIAFAGLAGTVALNTKAFADFETGLIGVDKTANLGAEQLAKFGEQVQDLSTTIPVSTGELLSIAQAAGQLGVKGSDNLLKFSETIAKLGRASDLSGDAAATALTRILTVTGDGVETIDRFASVIVRLGNNFAATESEIAAVSTRVAQATAVFKLGAQNVAGISTALRALGVNAELGGTAVGRAFQEISASIDEGGSKFRELQKLTGLTGDELKKTFKEDATEVFRLFVKGLGDVNEQGGSVNQQLKALGLSGQRTLQVFGALASGSNTLDDALQQANEEFKNATALNDEFEKAAASLTNQFVLFKNQVVLVAQNIGAELAPVVRTVLAGFTELFKLLDDPLFSIIARDVLLVGTALTGLVATLSAGALAWIKLKRVIRVANIALKATGLTVKTLVGATGIGLLIIIAAEILARWEEIFPKLEKIFEAFAKKIERLGVGLSLIIGGIASGSLKLVKEGMDQIKIAFTEAFDEISEDTKARAPAAQKDSLNAILAKPEAVRTRGERIKLEQAQALEATLAQNREFQALSEEERKAFLDENITDLRNHQATRLSIEDETIRESIRKQQAAHAEFLKNEKEFGTGFAKIQKVINDDRVSRTKGALGEVSKLQQSSNKELKAIGKAAAIANVLISTAEGAAKAYAGLAWIPFVGPGLGAAAAAAVIAFGGAQIGTIAAAQQGGVIPGAGPNRDSVPAVLSPGELVVPRPNFNEVIDSVATQRAQEQNIQRQGEASGAQAVGGVATIEVSLVGDAAEMFEAKLIERQNLGISIIQTNLQKESA